MFEDQPVSNIEDRPYLASANECTNGNHQERLEHEKALRFKVDLRLCTIAGLLCSLNLLDSGIISSASVTSMLEDLGLDEGNHYSVAILIFTISALCFQLPATIGVRQIGPRIFFAGSTVSFGLLTLVGYRPEFKGESIEAQVRDSLQRLSVPGSR